MIPRVVIHNGASLDGRLDWGSGDIGLYYELAGRLGTEAMLSGSATLLAAYAGSAVPDEDPGPAADRTPADPGDPRPLLAVVDSRGRINNWDQIRREPYWKEVVVLCAHATPPAYLARLQRRGLRCIQAGDERVDLRAALETLHADCGVRAVRVDSGGVLNGVLLRAGLVDEVSLILNPCLVGGSSPSSIFTAPDLTSPEGVVPLQLEHLEQLDGGVVWLRYRVVK